MHHKYALSSIFRMYGLCFYITMEEKRTNKSLKPKLIKIADKLLRQGRPVSFQDVGVVFERDFSELLVASDKNCSFTKKSYYISLKHAIDDIQTLLEKKGQSLIIDGNRRHRTFTYPEGVRLVQELSKKETQEKKNDVRQLLNYVITEGRTVSITYSAGFQRLKELVLHPYKLKLYNNRWFVVGLAIDEGTAYEDSIYALDRIMEISEKPDIKYIRPKKDYTHYFDDIVGVTHVRNRPRQRIEIATLDKYTHYRILTKPLHASQKEVAPFMDEDGEGIISINVIPNFELRSLLLSFGPTIKVLSPPDLADDIRKQVTEMAQIYESTDSELD